MQKNSTLLALMLPITYAKKVLQLQSLSKSQIAQDLFCLAVLDFKMCGFFVEFGATNGFDLSNTWLLEKEFGWSGILAEPAKNYHPRLFVTRSYHIETAAVFSESQMRLQFSENLVVETSHLGSPKKGASSERAHQYEVTTISLGDLLKKYNVPKSIDFLSIDFGGSEFDILKSFNFDEYVFSVNCCEHNWTRNRKKVKKLLLANGYVRIGAALS